MYKNVCAACHSLERIHFRELVGVCMDEETAKAAAAEIDVVDGPNDVGQMFERPGKLADPLPSPYANGKSPPPHLFATHTVPGCYDSASSVWLPLFTFVGRNWLTLFKCSVHDNFALRVVSKCSPECCVTTLDENIHRGGRSCCKWRCLSS